MKVINFFGAPSSGKTTATSGLHHEMKKRWIEAELVQERAKELVLDDTAHLLADQLSILADQNKRQLRNLGKTEVCISESPLILSAFYCPPEYPHSFFQMTFDIFHLYDNVNIFLNRSHRFSGHGRIQNEAQSDEIAEAMKQFLQKTSIPYYEITASDATPRYLLWWLVNEGLIDVPDFASRFDVSDEPPAGWIKPAPWSPAPHLKIQSVDMAVRDFLKKIHRVPDGAGRLPGARGDDEPASA